MSWKSPCLRLSTTPIGAPVADLGPANALFEVALTRILRDLATRRVSEDGSQDRFSSLTRLEVALSRFVRELVTRRVSEDGSQD